MRTAILSVALLTAFLAACSSQPPAPEQKPAAVQDRLPSEPSGGSQIGSESIDANSLAALKDPKSPLSKRNVFFDYDSFQVKDDYKSLLDAHGKFLSANGKIKMLIQGNADERGSREYNLALGQKRAEAVKKMLIINGGKEGQIEAVSLGEEKPRCTELNETCWAQNRRGDMLYTGEF